MNRITKRRWLQGATAALLCASLLAATASIRIFRNAQVEKRYNELAIDLSRLSEQIARQKEKDAQEEWKRWFFTLPPAPAPLRARMHALAAPAASAVGLTSFTPSAAFRGNQTAIVGRVLETVPGKGASVLSRASGCTLVQYAYPDLASTADDAVTLSGVERHLRAVSGLAAAGATYPRGCDERTLGIPSSNAAFLGSTAAGNTLVAGVDERGTLTVSQISAAGAVIAAQIVARNAAPTFAVADLNGDALADIVSPHATAADGSTGVAVFLSQASGNYLFPARAFAYAATASAHVARLAIDDIDGDGKPDVVAIAGPDIFTGTTLALRGDGAGGFVPAGAPRALSSALGTPFVIADIDADGKKDLLTADGLFLGGAGDGSFAAPVQRLDVAPSQPVGNLATGDFDGDGKLDVAVLGSLRGATGRFVSIFLGRGDGSFASGPVYSTVARVGELAVVDLDGDGTADLWLGKADTGVYSTGRRGALMHFLLGKGDGSFAGAPVVAAPGVRGAPSFAVADFSGDGKPDLVGLPIGTQFTTDPSRLQLFVGGASGSFAAPLARGMLGFTPTLVANSDFNGDGKADLVVAGIRLAVLLGQGNGNFGNEQIAPLPPGASGITNLAVGDINGDGRADVVVVAAASGFNTAGAFVYYGNGDGTLRAPVQLDAGAQLGPLAVGDLDGDGRTDIAVAENGANLFITGSVRVYLGRADGSFAAPRVLTPATYTTALTIADIDKNGRPDLIVGGATASFQAQVSVLAGNGDGSFAAPRVFALADGIGESISALAAGDFTFDGQPDLLVGRDGGATEFLIGDGSGAFVHEVALAIAAAATHAVAVDLDGDTVMDAVVAVGQSAIVPLLRTRQVGAASSDAAPFTFTASHLAGSVASGEQVQSTLRFAFPAGFAETVALSCSGLPANASCSFAPASLAPAASAASSVLTIRTGGSTEATAGAAGVGGGTANGALALQSLALAALLAVFVAAMPTPRARRLRHGAAVLAATGCVAACGGGGDAAEAPPPAATPSGSYNIAVTATSASGTQSLNYTLTVR